MKRTLSIPSVQIILIALVALAAVFLPAQGLRRSEAHLVPPFLNGEIRGDGTAACSDFSISFFFFDKDIPDPSWTPVNKGNPGFPQFRSVSGEVSGSRVSYTDYPDVHDSHDGIFDIMVDPGQEDLLSDANRDLNGDDVPDSIEVEWEAGIRTNEFSGDGSLHFYPKWVWPSEGDRVWANGDWIFDCGHPSDIEGKPHARSEIHPARAVASMRQQMRTLPGSGTTPVPVTATDLYIHGRAGFVTDMLDCGDAVILGPTPACPDGTPFGDHDPVADHHPRPIDEDFEFTICTPPLPFDKAALATFIEEGPGNTVTDPSRAPNLDPDGDGQVAEPSTGACASDPAKFGPVQVNVRIPLADSGVIPDDVYARKIYAGWVFPSENLKHLKLTLNKMDLHDDLEPDFFDCECTFFWMNVDRAPDEWIRLSDFATGNMNDYDSDAGLLGDGEMGFSGAEFDFFVGNDMPYTVRANGYDGGYGDSIPGADCLDDHFGHHDFESHLTIDINFFPPALTFPDFCYALLAVSASVPDNDDFAQVNESFGPADYLGSKDSSANGEYELEYTVEEIPLAGTVEDTADLSVTKDCKPNSNALAGQEFTCTIVVQNSGPGLPRHVVVDDVLLTDVDPSDYTMDPPTFTFPGVGFDDPCITPDNPIDDLPGGIEFRCDIGTVPVGGKAIITVNITSDEGGDFNNFAHVFTDSTDSNPANNQSDDSINVLAVSDLSITKSDDPDPVLAGNTLTYTLDVTNNGPSAAVNVVVQDVLPAELDIVSVSASGANSCNAGTPGDPSDPTRCAFDTLASGASGTMTIVVTVHPDAVTNVATDELIMHDDASVFSDTLDLDNSNNLDTEDTTVQAEADLRLDKFALGTPIAGTDISYEYHISNTGPSVSRDVTFRDFLPPGVSFVSAFVDVEGGVGGVPLPCTVTAGVNELVCPLGDIPPTNGVPILIFVNVHIAADVPDGAFLINNADVLLTDTPDPDTDNNSAGVTVEVITRADLSISKTTDRDLFKPSTTVKYTIRVTNNGPSDAQDVKVVDSLPPVKVGYWVFDTGYVYDPDGCSRVGTTLTCEVGKIAAGASIQFDIYFRVVGNKGLVTNTAIVSSLPTFDPNSSNNTAIRINLIQGKDTGKR